MAWTKKTNIKGTKIFAGAAAPTDSDKANKINGDK